MKPHVPNVDEFMQLARERYSFAMQQDSEDRLEAEQDVDFVGGDQWDKKALAKRKKFKMPVLTWNRLQTFVAQVVNDGRENKPSIRTSAMDGGKKATAEFFQSRIRQLEYETDADIAYDTAREQQVVSGRGFYRVTTEYKPGGSFDQRVRIEPIDNQFSVLFDPTAKKYDRSDADWCFVFSHLSKDAYERKYGKDTAAAASNYFAAEENPAPDWVGTGKSGDLMQVAEYWLKEYETRTLSLLEDLTAVYEDEMTGQEKSPVMDTREDEVCTVCQYIIDGVEPLDKTEFLVPMIPIVPVWGKQMVIRGERRNYSLVRFAKDPQKLVNLYVSNIALHIAQMPKTPYIGAVGQFLGREDEWEKINEDPRAFVQYHPKDVNGNPLPPPRRETSEPPIQALTEGLNQAIDAIKAAMGIFDASLGSGPGDTSGIAIQKRQKESDVANFHFPDNEARSRKYLGRILLALIPILDKGAKEVPTRSEDGKVKLVKVNQAYRDDKTGETMTHNLTQGNYDIAISTGPSYNSQRQQANDAYGEIAANDKNFMTIAGDLYFATSDMPGADLIAERYKKMLPPQLQEQGPNGPGAAAQAQQQLQQLGAQHQQLVAQVHQMAQVIEQKQVEAASRERIAEMQEATKMALGEMAAKTQTMARQQADRLAVLETTNAIADRAHEHALASVGAQQDAAAQQSDQAHQVSQQQNSQDAAAQQQQSAQDASAEAAETAQQQPKAA
jgi:Phage P22-like portal protein